MASSASCIYETLESAAYERTHQEQHWLTINKLLVPVLSELVSVVMARHGCWVLAIIEVDAVIAKWTML